SIDVFRQPVHSSDPGTATTYRRSRCAAPLDVLRFTGKQTLGYEIVCTRGIGLWSHTRRREGHAMPRDHKLERSRKTPMTPGRRWLIGVGAVVLLIVLGWGLYTVIEPAFQTRIVITTGADKGIYRGFAERYAPLLKRDGVTLDIRSSSGSVENYQRLKDPSSDYQVGFIQSGTTIPQESDRLETIAHV